MKALKIFSNILCISILFISSCSLFKPETFYSEDGSVTTKNITESRDMFQYEQAGSFHSRWKSNLQKNGERKVRDFIWQHWIEKKRGYIKITSNGIDTSNTTHYFIEPDEKGEWQIAQRIVYKHGLSEYDNQPILDDIVTVERIESKEESDDWQLVIKTKSGENVNILPNL